MATCTSVGSGLWSAAGTWDTGIPVNGDDVIIASGHTVTFNVDQSAFVTGVKLTVTGKLDFTKTTGSYCLMLKSDADAVTGTGVFECGTELSPIPSNVRHKITAVGNLALYKISSENTSLAGVEPTYKVIKTVNNESVGATRIEIDTDVTSDLWAVGDHITITENGGVALAKNSCEIFTIANITSSYIDLNTGLVAAKSAGSHIVLGRRNVHVQHTTLNRFFQSGGTFISVSIYGTHSYNSQTKLVGGVLVGAGTNLSNNKTPVIGTIFTKAVFYIANTLFINCKFYGCTSTGGYENYNCEFYNSALPSAPSVVYGGKGEYVSSVNQYENIYDMDFGTGAASNFWNVPRATTLTNCKIGNAQPYNFNDFCDKYQYVESFDHEQVSGAFKGWTKGGITTSQTSVLPSGYELAYITLPTSASFEGWHRKHLTVHAGANVSVEVQLRKSASMAYLPRVYLMNSIENPLVDATDAEDSFTMTDSTNTWETGTFTIDNSAGTTDLEYTLWFVAKNASGSVYSAYNITTAGGTGGGAVKIMPLGRVGL